MIAIIDYDVGNLFSLKSSFSAIGAEVVVTADPAVIDAADRIILPGVGAFEDAARKLRDSGMADVVRQQAAAVHQAKSFWKVQSLQTLFRVKSLLLLQL